MALLNPKRGRKIKINKNAFASSFSLQCSLLTQKMAVHADPSRGNRSKGGGIFFHIETIEKNIEV